MSVATARPEFRSPNKLTRPLDDPKTTQRKLVAEELLSTERTYANEIGRFMETFWPRMEAADTPSKQRFVSELSGLVRNLEQFLFVARHAVQELESCSKTRVGPAVLRLTSVLPLYTQYAKNYALASKNIRELMNDDEFIKDWRGDERDRTSMKRPTSVKILRKTSLIETTVNAAQAKNIGGGSTKDVPTPAPSPSPAPSQPTEKPRVTSLEGFLILPVQRVPRYTLLFQELLKRLDDPKTENDRKEKKDLETALEAARSCASAMNEAIETVKRLNELKELQKRLNDNSLLAIFSHPEARVVRADTLTKVSRNGSRRAFQYYLIAPDSLLCALEEADGSLKLRRQLKLVPKASTVEVKDEAEQGSFVVETMERTLTLVAPNNMVRDEWVTELNRLISAVNLSAPPPLPRRSFFGRRQSSAPPPITTSVANTTMTMSNSPTVSPQASGSSSMKSPPTLTSGGSPMSKSMSSMPTSSPLSRSTMTMVVSSQDDSPQGVYCHVCGTTFSLLHRRHGCGRCSKDVCSSCSTQRRTIEPGKGTPVRTCDVCADEMDLACDTLDTRFVRLVIEVNGSFRKEGSTPTEKFPRENYWAVEFANQVRGPSPQGKFTMVIPYAEDPFPKATLMLLAKQGSVVVAQVELDVEERIRNPRSHHGLQERVDLLDSFTKLKVASVVITFEIDPPSDLFLPLGELEKDPSDHSILGRPVRATGSDGGAQERRRHTRRRSLNMSEKLLNETLTGVRSTSTPSSVGLSNGNVASKYRLNMSLIKEYEKFSLENPHLIVPWRLCECLLNWAIDKEQEGSDVQTQLASMLYRFHRRRSTTVRGEVPLPPAYPSGSNPSTAIMAPPIPKSRVAMLIEEKEASPRNVGSSSSVRSGGRTSDGYSNQEMKEESFLADKSLNRSSSPSLLSSGVGANSAVTHLLESETDYVAKLEILVEKHRIATDAAKKAVFKSRGGTSEGSPGVGRGTVLRLASTFGQTSAGGGTSSETALLIAPSVFACLSAAEQMLTIHKSLAEDLASLGSDSLQRLASLTKVYSSYGATLVEAFLIVASAQSSPTNKSSASSSTGGDDEGALSASGWLRLGASQRDPHDAIRWILTAGGSGRAFNKITASNDNLLDLLLSPLQRMDDYCQFARELDSPALAALNETRRLLTKSIMRKSNTRLLREIDNGFVDLEQSLVDVRRWMLRFSPLVWRKEGSPDRIVHVFLFSDMLVLAEPAAASSDRWTIERILAFSGDKKVFIRDAVYTPQAESSTANNFLLNPSSSPVGDARFGFEVGTCEEDVITIIMPNASSLVSNKQLSQFWNKLGLVTFDKETATAIGPGGFSSLDQMPKRTEAATVKTTDRSKDVKRKQGLNAEWFSDIGRLIRIWGGAKSDACWFDDVVALRLIKEQQRLSRPNSTMTLSAPPILAKSESSPN